MNNNYYILDTPEGKKYYTYGQAFKILDKLERLIVKNGDR